MRTSTDIDELTAAFVAAQSEMTNAPKETKGQVGNQTRYYTDLPTLWDHVRPVLAKHKLAVIQLPGGHVQGGVSLSTRLVHASGQWVEDDYVMPASGQGAQAIGSALTYGRRYALMALLGVAADDDDGAAASQAPARQQSRPVTRKGGGASESQITRLQILLTEAGIKQRDQKLTYCAGVIRREISTSKDMTPAECGQVIAALEQLIAEQDVTGAS